MSRVKTKSGEKEERRSRAGEDRPVVKASGRKPHPAPHADNLFSYRSADDSNVLTLIELVRKGISQQDFHRIVEETPFSLSEWARFLQLSERTIQRNEKENKAFQPIQSERIIELTMLYQYGVEVFGDKEHFDTWLTARSVALGGRLPKDLLDTKFGITLVKDELGRIEHGVLA
ncbi:MAG TPA: antitoxin Xre/MbcA/ParS toxin-binding domain-containing protein [Chitinophagaceae bacterium]|jgi:putative toxin-antitoxin system antitoxin component (TIGR02293 family)|nr:antitoxin Xre/MbcA/ParS toxin-binding domain-containing protein [Chitinophagaceae bacterium]